MLSISILTFLASVSAAEPSTEGAPAPTEAPSAAPEGTAPTAPATGGDAAPENESETAAPAEAGPGPGDAPIPPTDTNPTPAADGPTAADETTAANGPAGSAAAPATTEAAAPPDARAAPRVTDPFAASEPFIDPSALGTSIGGGSGRSISLGAFADLSLGIADPIKATEMAIGQVVVHSRAHVGNGFSVFGEFTLNSNPGFQARVERLLFDWEASDTLKVSAGRMHSPITWWNSTFHHGVWLQTTASRPRMVNFGHDHGGSHSHSSSFIPNHIKGLRLSGFTPFLEQAGLRYQVGVTTSNDDDAPADGETIPFAGAIFGVLAFEPPSAPFLRVGVTANQDFEQALGAQTRGARRTQTGAHVAYTSERPELIAEVVLVNHVDPLGSSGAVADAQADDHGDHDAGHSGHSGHATTNGASHLSGGGYVQLAWRLRAAGERLKPYLRYEQDRLHQHDLSLTGLGDEELLLGGLRVDLTPAVALKGEGIWTVQRPEDWSALLQLSAAW